MGDMMYVIPAAGIIALGVAGYLIWSVLKEPLGNDRMREVGTAIRQGAMAFLARQYRTIAMLSILLAIVIWAIYSFTGKGEYGVRTAVAFIVGAFCSGLAGFIGMWTAVQSNGRAAQGAFGSLNKALQLSFRGGAVTGLSVVSLSLLGVWAIFMAYGGASGVEGEIKHAPDLIVGFGFGASFVALFAQLGGGIYTKAADVGADLVGKVEAGIPEDDPRNPAVIADLVGDNVGDCAGRGADLFESTAAENIGAMILGVALWPAFGIKGIIFPLIARAFGLVGSILGIFTVRTKETESPMTALNRGYLVTTVICAAGLWLSCRLLLSAPGVNYMYFVYAAWIGLAMSYLFVWITTYYTDLAYAPVKRIAEACRTGPATTIIAGTAVGMECVAIPVIAICAAIFGAYQLGAASGLPGGGLYGTAVATMGMLATCAYILAMDTFGPITDNAGGIAEMSHAPEGVRRRTDRLDAAGNSTKAITKGYAVGSAALAAFLLFRAYLDEVNRIAPDHPITAVDLGKPVVFIGAFVGAMLVYLFSSFAIRAVGRAAESVILEVRRQFKEIPGIMQGTAKPDYATCVDIVTVRALKEMVLPGLLAVATPILIGILLKAEAAAALLMSGTISGVILALYLNNSGGAWDNAKKMIELGAHGGKGSDAHKAGVVGDTVGDPYKDTAGPSLHVLIKLLSTITLVLAALFVR